MPESASPIFRFAPSPNGFLHLGHALSALTVDGWARRLGGRFLLRIEDIDPVRSRHEFIAAIYCDLEWLGLRWEQPVLRQSEHMDAYQSAARRLRDMGLLYPCFATRGEIAATADPNKIDPEGAPLYPGLHRNLSPTEIALRIARGEPHCLRIDMTKAMTLLKTKSGALPLRCSPVCPKG